MTARSRRRPVYGLLLLLLVLIASGVVWALAEVQAAETPRRGGVLLAAIGADAPSLDPHQESTFANIQLVAPLYSTLLQFDPLARIRRSSATLAPSGRSPATASPTPFKLRQGIKFHDGSLADRGRRQGHLRQDRLPAGGRPEHPEGALRGDQARSRRPTRARWCSSSSSRRPSLARQPGLAVERDLPEEVPRQGPELLQDPRRRLGAVQVQGLHARARRSRASATPTTSSRTGPISTATSSSSARRPPSGPRRSAPAAPTSSSATCPTSEVEAIKKQLGDKVVVQETPTTGQLGVAHQHHGEALQRRARPQGAHARHRPVHRWARCSTRSRASRTSAG